MPRFYQLTRGRTRQFTAEEETARDAEEKAWADNKLNIPRSPLPDFANTPHSTKKSAAEGLSLYIAELLAIALRIGKGQSFA